MCKHAQPTKSQEMGGLRECGKGWVYHDDQGVSENDAAVLEYPKP